MIIPPTKFFNKNTGCKISLIKRALNKQWFYYKLFRDREDISGQIAKIIKKAVLWSKSCSYFQKMSKVIIRISFIIT